MTTFRSPLTQHHLKHSQASASSRQRDVAIHAVGVNQLQDSFLATISHELRTPLTALAGYGELLADGIYGELTPTQFETVDRMRAVTHQLAVMIDSILTFSSLEAGSEKPVPSTFIPAEVLRDVVTTMEPIARKKGIELSVTANDGPVMSADREKVRQILMHLTDNAIKFSHTGSPCVVKLDVADRDHSLCFTVEDCGIGISPRDLERLFQPFCQIDTGLTRRNTGIGIGLYISQRLADLLGGVLAVESTVDVGSKFCLVIPREPLPKRDESDVAA